MNYDFFFFDISRIVDFEMYIGKILFLKILIIAIGMKKFRGDFIKFPNVHIFIEILE